MSRIISIDVSSMPIINIEAVLIDGEKAEEMLKKNTNNRKIKRATVEMYRRDMQSGNWHCNGVPIVLNEKGVIKDGQHRLAAIKQSKKAQWMLVVTICDEEAKSFDNNAIRTMYDRLQMGEFSEMINHNVAVLNSTMAAAIARTYLSMKGIRKPSPDEIARFIARHEESIEFAARYYGRGKKGIKRAQVFIAVAAAYESGVSESILRGFCETYLDGVPRSPEFNPVVRLREWSMRNASEVGNWRGQIYLRTQYAIKAAEEGNANAVTKEAAKEYYKFSEEVGAEI